MAPQPAVRPIVELADLATPMAMRVAVSLGLVERAGETGATAERLAAEAGAEPAAIRCLLDRFVAVGVFDHDAPRDRSEWPASEVSTRDLADRTNVRVNVPRLV